MPLFNGWVPDRNSPIDKHSEKAAFPRFKELPPEIQSMIGVKAAVAEPAKLLVGIRKLRHVARPETSPLAADPGLSTAERWLTNATAELKDRVHDALYPKDGLPGREPINGVEPPLYPEELIKYTMGRWEHLNDGSKAKLVADILAVSDDAHRLAYIDVVAVDSDKMKAIHARPLAEEAMKHLEVSSSTKDYNAFEYAASSVVFLIKHINSEEDQRIEKILREDSICGDKFQSAIDYVSSVLSARDAFWAAHAADPKYGQQMTLPELRQAVEDILENPSTDAQEKNRQVNLNLSALPAAIRNSAVIEALALDNHLSAVPGDKGWASSARKELQSVERPRSVLGR